MKKAFVHATIIPVEGEVIHDGTILVAEGKILAIGGPSVDIGEAEIIDCSGKFLTPGLIDPHSHVGLFEEGAGPNYQDANEMSSTITPYLRVVDAIYPEDMGFWDARKAGVTTLGLTPGSANLIGGQFAVVKTNRGKMADEMVIKSPAGMKFALGENPKRVGASKNRSPSTRMANAYHIREALYKALEYKEEWEQYQQSLEVEERKPKEEQKPVKKPKRDLGLEALVELLDRQYPARFHSHRADDIRTAIRLADEFGFDIVIDHATEGHKIAEFLAERQVPSVVGPLLTSRSKRELVNRSVGGPGKIMEAGGVVCLTCDTPVIPIYMLREMMILATREGLDPSQGLAIITINPARVLGVDDRVGSLVPGKDADLVIWDGDPMDARSKVLHTFIEGDEVYSREQDGF